MNINLFTQLNTDCFQMILGVMELSSLSKMSRTCTSYNNIFRNVFKENRPECRRLLESGSKNKAIIELCLKQLKPQLIGQALLNKESFHSFAEVTCRRIAKSFSETRYFATYYSDPYKMIRRGCQDIMGDEATFLFLDQYGFSKHIAESYIETYQQSRNANNFLQFCEDVASILGNKPKMLPALEAIFEGLYEGWKQEYYQDLLGTCAVSFNTRQKIQEEIKTFNPDVLFSAKDVLGLAAVDRALSDPTRQTLKQRLAADMPLLVKRIEKELPAVVA